MKNFELNRRSRSYLADDEVHEALRGLGLTVFVMSLFACATPHRAPGSPPRAAAQQDPVIPRPLRTAQTFADVEPAYTFVDSNRKRNSHQVGLRGSFDFDMVITVSPDAFVDGFAGTSHDVPLPAAIRGMAERVVGLIRRWDEATYRKHLREPRIHTTKRWPCSQDCELSTLPAWSSRQRLSCSIE
jgi:hypothetical protein